MGNNSKTGVEEGRLVAVDQEGRGEGEAGDGLKEIGRRGKKPGEGATWKEVERKRQEGKKAQE